MSGMPGIPQPKTTALRADNEKEAAMQQLIYDPAKSGKRMTIVCFVSGSGTNYRRLLPEIPSTIISSSPIGPVAAASPLLKKINMR
jgi:hypothetical protein